MVATHDYDAFGNILAESTPVGGGGQAWPFEHRAFGELYDRDLGMVFLRARWMSPEDGRFVSRDPFGGAVQDPRSLHRYSYVANDPLNLIDPGGEEILTILAGLAIFTALGAVFTSAANAAEPTGSASGKAVEWKRPANKIDRQLAGVIFLESSTPGVGRKKGENAEEKDALGWGIANRTFYAKLTRPARDRAGKDIPGTAVPCSNSGFGDGTLFEAIRTGSTAWKDGNSKKIFDGNDLKPDSELAKALTLPDRLHLKLSIEAAQKIDVTKVPHKVPGLGDKVPVWFRSDKDDVDGLAFPGRAVRIGEIHSFWFYGFTPGRECR